MRKKHLTSRYSGRRVIVALTVVLVFTGASGLATSAEKRQATYSVDELLAGCAKFGTRVVTSTGQFKVLVDDVRKLPKTKPQGEGEGRRPAESVGTTGKWVFDKKGRRFQEDSLTKFKTRAKYREVSNKQQVKYGGFTRRDVIEVKGNRLVFTQYDGTRVIDRQNRTADGNGMQVAFERAVSTRWLGFNGRLRLPTKQDDVHIVGHEKVGGAPCIKLSARKGDGGIWRTWWISPERDYMVMRLDEVKNARKGRPPLRMRREVKEARKFDGGIWLPTVVTWEAAKTDAKGNVQKPVRAERFEATKLTVNRPAKKF